MTAIKYFGKFKNPINTWYSIIKNMCKILFLLVTLFIGANSATLSAQGVRNYIIVKMSGSEIVAINPDSISSQYITDGKWVFVMKGTTQTYSYTLTDALSFATRLSNSNSQTEINDISSAMTFSVYDKGDMLVIKNSSGSVGNYNVYTTLGQLIKSGYELGNQVYIPVSTRGIYLIKVGNASQKTIKN